MKRTTKLRIYNYCTSTANWIGLIADFLREPILSLVCINSYVTNDTEQWSLFYRQKSNDKLVDAFIFRMRARRRRFPLPPSFFRSLFLFLSLSSLFNKNDSYLSERFALRSIFSRQLQSLYNVFLASHGISHYTLRLGIPMHLRKRMLSMHFACIMYKASL